MKRSLLDLEQKDLSGKIFIVRIDTNVAISDGKVENDFRLRAVIPTLDFLTKRKARVILVGHKEPAPEASLEAVAEYYRENFPIKFVKSCEPEDVRENVEDLQNGEILLLENLRSLPYEKENDPDFSRSLASLADAYVNEAFSVSHREHASVVGVSRFLPSFSGLCFDKEIKELSFALSPERPFVFILGGLKFKTKAPLIRKFVEKADTVFVVGALANAFFREKGLEIGVSAADEGVDLSDLIKKDVLFLPKDVTVEKENGEREVVEPAEVGEKDYILDMGPATLAQIAEKIDGAKLLVWNGPTGDIEKGSRDHTYALAKHIADSKAYSIIGGGDTVASISGLGLEDQFSFVSTGGGAMLEFLVKETLPGMEALEDAPQGDL